MHFMDGWHMGGTMAGWWLFAVAAVLAVVWMLYRALAQPRSGSGSRPDSAEDLLKRRYASGDLSREEYQRKLDDLHHGPA